MPRGRKILSQLGLALSFPLILVLIAVKNEHKPIAIEPASQTNRQEKAVPIGEDIRLVSWNIQFAGSRKHHFFYDGGQAVHVPKKDVEETLQHINDALLREGTDIALIQEVDRFSERTAEIDQLDELLQYRTGLNWAVTPYHKVPYVPTPSHEHMGRVNLNLAIISSFSLSDSKRHQLALLDEPRWRQYFNLKRAILESSLPLEGNRGVLRVAVTHLSAFSKGDGTLNKQIAQVKEWMDSQPEDQPWILAGDFNLLPPDDTASRLGEDSELYSDETNPIEDIIPSYQTAFPKSLINKHRTYLPFGAEKPDRKIDYIFYGGPIEIKHAVVLRDQSHVSDHLPLKIVFQIKDLAQ
jgi:endonuclease/exonuclease/phosphatase family metal-dependent hydrolase